MTFRPASHLITVLLCPLCLPAADTNNNQQSDIWELAYGATGLPASGDADGDGFSNAVESAAGTNPLSALDFPALDVAGDGAGTGNVQFLWHGVAGKKYTILGSSSLSGTWSAAAPNVSGEGDTLQVTLSTGAFTRQFFKLSVADQDTDGDGITDADERLVGFDPATTRTERSTQLDSVRLAAGLTAANTITVSVYDDTATERWPDPILFTVRRAGGLQPLTVNVSLTGTATRGADYTTSFAGTAVKFAAGQREVFVEATPVADTDDAEPAETIILTALPGSGYTVGAQNTATGNLLNETATSNPSAKAAARFLIQAAFGPDQDSDADADQIPENVEEVMQLGFNGWINDQFTRPVGSLQPFVQWAIQNENALQIYNDKKQDAWWGRVMGLPKLRPDATSTQQPDPLRQRVGYSLSQIFIISDRMEDLAVNPLGMVHYYDMLLGHTFGNFRDLLFDVAMHPCMGLYLSHLGNQKPNPASHRFPDENFAREIMQLFSVGLWELNQDGTRKLDPQGNPIATYSNADITELARVFTGLAFGGDNVNFGLWPRDFTSPMKAWDAEHDLAPKKLLRGVTTPARTASPADTGTATMLDVNAAVDNLFNHPNVGPFMGRLLIQRLVTSNPSPAYVGRVAAAFANNGQGVRGDMKAFIKAILLDPEARDPAMMNDPNFGKLREPFLRCVNLARAFNAYTASGWYYLDAFTLDHVQEPMKSPSVFNFYLPDYAPPGTLVEHGLVAPEFQIINATSATMAPNYFWNAITGGLHRWGTGRAEYETHLNLSQEMLMNVPAAGLNDPNPN
ncbi:MAG TPA: DUF1800 family protein, partial [Verrucomicrobiales bacterium]|nr:DUF1800 family protein [Verrucomicrobiales bacterium]